MGADVYTVGRHNLDTNSLESLAKDLSDRFKVNIQYGIFVWLFLKMKSMKAL